MNKSRLADRESESQSEKKLKKSVIGCKIMIFIIFKMTGFFNAET